MFYRITVSTLPDVQQVAQLRYPPGHTEKETTNQNTLFYILSGKCVLNTGSHRHVTLTEGMHLLLPEGTPYTAAVEEDCDFYLVRFRCTGPLVTVPEGEALASLQEDVEIQKGARGQEYRVPPREALYIAHTAYHGERAKSLRYRISRCAEFRRGISPLDRMRLLNSFFKVLISLAATTGEQMMDATRLPPTLIKITQYIEENYTASISLQTVATHFSLSKQYIMRLFRRQMGMTVTHYINEIRLRKSLELLTYHSLSVSEVAYAVGFSSLYYFDRIFKKTYSLTPGEYQKRHRIGTPADAKQGVGAKTDHTTP